MLVRKTSGLVTLADALRSSHEALAEIVRKEIEKRKAQNIPLDDETNFAIVEEEALLLKNAASDMRGADARDIAIKILGMVSGGLRELEPYEPNEDHAGVRLRLRSVTERERIDARERIDSCSTQADRHDVFADFVARAYVEIQGISDEDGPVRIAAEDGRLPAEAMEVLEQAGLISDLWATARHYAELPHAKKKHFGSQVPSTSAPSSAPGATGSSAKQEDATAAQLPATDSPTSSTTPVPAGTF